MMLDDILHLLTASPLLHRLQVIELVVYGQDAFRVKVRADVGDELTLQVWLNHNDRHTRYAYQLFSSSQTILRWDNAPHHPEQGDNYPHHMHIPPGGVVTSPLTGKPVVDLPEVLKKIESHLRAG